MASKTKVPLRGTVETPDGPTPTQRTLPDGQKADHWILPEEERAKGFVRPVRTSYRHVGIAGPTHPLTPYTGENGDGYWGMNPLYEKYPPDPDSSVVGRVWPEDKLAKVGKGCGTVTTMPQAIAETYARQPGYYGSTFCCGCGTYLPVGRDGEFIWDDGSNQRVGT